MSKWNNRVVRKKDHGIFDNEYYYEVHETFYNDAGGICAITSDAITPMGETVGELEESLQRMLRACSTPVLIDGEIEYSDWDANTDTEDD